MFYVLFWCFDACSMHLFHKSCATDGEIFSVKLLRSEHYIKVDEMMIHFTEIEHKTSHPWRMHMSTRCHVLSRHSTPTSGEVGLLTFFRNTWTVNLLISVGWLLLETLSRSTDNFECFERRMHMISCIFVRSPSGHIIFQQNMSSRVQNLNQVLVLDASISRKLCNRW
jgi:hypothetical protein